MEAVTGSPLTTGTVGAAVALGAAAPAVALFASAPLLGLIPALLQTFAAERQSKRFQAAIEAINKDLEAIPEQRRKEISDAQFQFASEAVGHMLSTAREEKLAYLRHAVVNSIKDAGLTSEWGERLSRLIRDISMSEVSALLSLFNHDGICIADTLPSEQERVGENHYVVVGTPEARDVEGLIQLGLLQSHAANYDFTLYTWTPLTAKLIALLKAT